MSLANHVRRSALQSALLCTTLASAASAQDQTWIRQFGAAGSELATAAAPDGVGGVYVGGYGGEFGGPGAGASDAWLVRFDGAGNQTWVRQLGSSVNDYLSAAATDGAGGVYFSGETYGDLDGPNAGDRDAWLVRYDGAGTQAWIRQLGTSAADYSSAVTSDGAGGAYVSGTTAGSLGGPNAGEWDAWLARYDGAGNQIWIRQLGSSFGDRALAAAADGSGGVFVGGSTRGDLGAPNAGIDDAWLAHFDGAGNQAWIRQIGSLDRDSAVALAADGSGGVFVSGETDSSLAGPNAGPRDAWFARYDGAGHQLWIRQLGSRRWDVASAAAPDASGGVYISGFTDGSLGGPNAGGADGWLARYDGGLIAARYCSPGVPNSTGQSGTLIATGDNMLAANDVTLEARQLPQNSFGYLLTSRTPGLVVGAGGSQGTLCVGGTIGRYVGPGQIGSSGATGSFSLAIDLTVMPTPTGLVAALPGETWHFQAWHRDANPTPTSNFTDAVSVSFL